MTAFHCEILRLVMKVLIFLEISNLLYGAISATTAAAAAVAAALVISDEDIACDASEYYDPVLGYCRSCEDLRNDKKLLRFHCPYALFAPDSTTVISTSTQQPEILPGFPLALLLGVIFAGVLVTATVSILLIVLVCRKYKKSTERLKEQDAVGIQCQMMVSNQDNSQSEANSANTENVMETLIKPIEESQRNGETSILVPGPDSPQVSLAL